MSRSANLALRSLQLNSTSFVQEIQSQNQQERKTERKKERKERKKKDNMQSKADFVSQCHVTLCSL